MRPAIMPLSTVAILSKRTHDGAFRPVPAPGPIATASESTRGIEVMQATTASARRSLLPIGVTGLWAGSFHVFLPATAAALIGWEASPFQFEVGMADLAFGLTACIAFWRNLSFKAAEVSAASIFLLGDAVGHVRQMRIAGSFAPGNAGVPFYTDIICPLLAITLLLVAGRRRAGRSSWRG
jgi:hypothetical protein